MQYSTLIHSNSQNNFNYNSIHRIYNVFSVKKGQGNFILGNLEVNRQIRFSWIHADPPSQLPVPVCLEIFSICEVLFDVSIYILICHKTPLSFDVLFKVVRWNRKTFLFSLCFLFKVVRWNRKTFLFSFCFLFLLLFSSLYRLDWFRDISFVFQPISFKLGSSIDHDKRRSCMHFHVRRSKVKVTRSQNVFDCNDSIYGQRQITLS